MTGINGGYAYGDWSRDEVLPFVPDCPRILDVGCSFGGFGELLKRRASAPVVWGVEPEGDAATVAADRLDRVIIGEYPQALSVGERFDCVIFNDVLEHMVDPWKTLRETLNFLEPSGVVVASIPNVRFGPVVSNLLLRGKWTYTDIGVLDRTHLRFFTRSSMKELFFESGYIVQEIHPIRQLRRGRIAMLGRAIGALGEELTAPQFVVVATPTVQRLLPS